MSLLDCENAFQTNNLQLLAEQYNINIADADILQAKIWELPQLSGYVNGYNPENRKAFNVDKAKGFEVTQLIYMGGKKKNEIAFAKSNKELAQLQFSQLLVELRMQLHTNYYNLYYEKLKLENTNNLDTAEYTMDGMQANSNGKLVRFGTLGINAGDQVIAGVKAGVADTDVVNVKQLKDSISNIGNVKTSTLKVDANGKVTGESGLATSDNVATVINQVVEQNTSDTKELKQAISSVSSETQRVGAHAAAMAALKPIQYDPMEPTQVMAGIGNYRGETAAALGLAHYTNENTMLNVGVSLGGTHNMVNAGVTHKFGSSPEKKNIPDRYKGGPISSIYVMQDEMTRMQAKNDAQQVEIEQQRDEIESLKSMVQQLLAKH